MVSGISLETMGAGGDTGDVGIHYMCLSPGRASA